MTSPCLDDQWDVAMDALLEHKSKKAAAIYQQLRVDHPLAPPSTLFLKALIDVPDTIRRDFEIAANYFPVDTALFSDDRVYRWLLTRELGGDRTLGIIGLNPSIATADKNDPTIRREIGFAGHWGCGRLVKANAFAFVATDPRVMKQAAKEGIDVVGSENDAYIRRMIAMVAASSGVLLVAWGCNITQRREQTLAELITSTGVVPMCLGISKSGHPKHPLYISYGCELRRWAPSTTKARAT